LLETSNCEAFRRRHPPLLAPSHFRHGAGLLSETWDGWLCSAPDPVTERSLPRQSTSMPYSVLQHLRMTLADHAYTVHVQQTINAQGPCVGTTHTGETALRAFQGPKGAICQKYGLHHQQDPMRQGDDGGWRPARMVLAAAKSGAGGLGRVCIPSTVTSGLPWPAVPLSFIRPTASTRSAFCFRPPPISTCRRYSSSSPRPSSARTQGGFSCHSLSKETGLIAPVRLFPPPPCPTLLTPHFFHALTVPASSAALRVNTRFNSISILG
jgi:hypothetical protein